jgi:hypothetical protein
MFWLKARQKRNYTARETYRAPQGAGHRHITPQTLPKAGASRALGVIGLLSRPRVKNVRLQHSISHYEITYRNLKKPKCTGRIVGFIFRQLKFHHRHQPLPRDRVGRKLKETH